MPVKLADRRFLRNPSSLWGEALAALKRVEEDECEDHVDRLYATAIWQVRLKTLLHANGYRLSSGHPCVARLLGKPCGESYLRWPYEPRENTPPCSPPGCDHPALLLKDGKPSLFVFQPYGLHGATLVELVAFCQRWGLHCSVDARFSWHFPGVTLLVSLSKRAPEAALGEGSME